MHQVPSGIASDYHSRCAAEISRLDDLIDHAVCFIESVILSVQPECFTTEQRADLSKWLASARTAREVLR